VRCSAGFYVRSLAFDLGSLLGTGAHLAALQRIEACGATLDQAIALERILADGGQEATESALIPMEQMLWALPSVALTDDGVAHVRFGRNLGPLDASSGFIEAVGAAGGPAPRPVRLLDPAGQLVAVAEAAEAPGLLHPAVVLM
jgi:tRNA pseudouridine55 synthase